MVPVICDNAFNHRPDRSKVVCIEAGRSDGWSKYVNHDALIVGIDRFGASAPYKDLYKHFGITPQAVAQAALRRL